jgi:hypothetical protein
MSLLKDNNDKIFTRDGEYIFKNFTSLNITLPEVESSIGVNLSMRDPTLVNDRYNLSNDEFVKNLVVSFLKDMLGYRYIERNITIITSNQTPTSVDLDIITTAHISNQLRKKMYDQHYGNVKDVNVKCATPTKIWAKSGCFGVVILGVFGVVLGIVGTLILFSYR